MVTKTEVGDPPGMGAGWGGKMISFLENVSRKDITQIPTQDRVVAMPRQLERLHADMRRTQNDLTIAQTQRGQIEMAWRDIVAHKDEMMSANEQQQREIIARYDALRAKWIDAGKEVGVRGEIVPIEIGG